MAPLATAHAALLFRVEDLHREAAARCLAAEVQAPCRRRPTLAARLRRQAIGARNFAFATARPAPHH